jgi:hypothetical protein
LSRDVQPEKVMETMEAQERAADTEIQAQPAVP